LALSDFDPTRAGESPAEFLLRLDEASRLRLDGLPGARRNGFVASELLVVQAALLTVLERDLCRGAVFCEWGSGMGSVCALAASLSFEAYGIEIQSELVESARELVAEMGVEATFAHGSFLMPGDEELVVDAQHTLPEVSVDAYRELGIGPEECDVVFAFPWPGEEQMHDRLFARHATPGALLLTYHDGSRLLIQQRTEDPDELLPLGWVDSPIA